MTASKLLQLALAAGGFASVLSRASESQGFLSLSIQHEPREANTILRRDNVVTLYNHSTIAYMVKLSIGTPPQTVQVQLDTGSDELWVDPNCAAISNPQSAQYCNTLGVYSPDDSSSAKDQSATKELHYGIGDVEIAYVSDSISIPGSSSKVLTEVVFGVATQSKNAAVPILGVGYGNGVNLKYNNLIDELAAQGVTNTKAFSLALGSSSKENAGTVIFGGVDTKKFTGKLIQFANLPPQANEKGHWRYWIQLDSVGLSKPGSSSTTYASSGAPIILDSGSTYSYLPSATMVKLATDFGSSVDSEGNIAVACSNIQQAGTIDFTFGSLTIRVPWREFIRQIDSNTCVLGAMPTDPDDPTAILGDTFLRSAYVVFDQTNQALFMAPAADCGSAEQAMPATTNATAGLTGQCTAGNSAVALDIKAALYALLFVHMVVALL